MKCPACGFDLTQAGRVVSLAALRRSQNELHKRAAEEERRRAGQLTKTPLPIIQRAEMDRICFYGNWMYRNLGYQVVHTPIQLDGTLDYARTENMVKCLAGIGHMRMKGGWLYFSKGKLSYIRDNKSSIFRLSLMNDDKKSERVSKGILVDSFDVDGDWVYIGGDSSQSIFNRSSRICRVNIRRSAIETLTKLNHHDYPFSHLSLLAPGDGKVYYLFEHRVYSMNTDGNAQQELTGMAGIIHKLFFADTLYAMNFDGVYRWNGTSWEKTADVPYKQFVSDGGKHFWESGYEPCKMWMSEFDGSNQRMVYSQQQHFTLITVHDNYAYCHRGIGRAVNDDCFRVNIQTGQAEKLKLN